MAEIRHILTVRDNGSIKIKRFDAAVTKAGRSMTTTTRKTETLGAGFRRVRGSLMLATAAFVTLVYALKKVTTVVSSFERQFANVSTLLNATPSIIETLKQGVLNLAGGMGTADEMTKGLYQTISAGITEPKQALEFLEIAGRAAAAGLATTFEAVDLGTSLLNAFGLASSEAGMIFDQVQTTIRLGKTTFEELAGSVGYAAPIFANAGLKTQDLLAAIAALTAQGINTQTAVTGLRQAVAQMINPTAEAAVLWEEYGFKNIAATLASEGLEGTLKLVKERVGDNNEALTVLFGNIRAYTAVAPLAGTASDKFAESLDAITNSSGELDTAFSKVSDTFEYQWAEAMETFRVALIESLLPALTELAQWLNENKQSIKALADMFEFLSGTLGEVVIQQLKAQQAFKETGRFQAELYTILKESKLSWWEIAKALVTSKDATEKHSSATAKFSGVLLENKVRVKGFASAILGAGGATDTFAKAVKKMEKSLKIKTIADANKELKILEYILKKAEKAGGKTTKSMNALKERIKELRDEIDGVTTEQEEYIDLLNEYGIDAVENLSAETEELITDFVELKKKTGDENLVLKKMREKIDEVVQGWKNAGLDIPEALQAIKDKSDEVKAVWEEMEEETITNLVQTWKDEWEKEGIPLLDDMADDFEDSVDDMYEHACETVPEIKKDAWDVMKDDFTDIFGSDGSMQSAFAGGLAGMLSGATSWKDALGNIWTMILNAFIKMVADMVVRWTFDFLGTLGSTETAVVGVTSALGTIAPAADVASVSASASLADVGSTAASVASQIASCVGWLAALVAIGIPLMGWITAGYPPGSNPPPGTWGPGAPFYNYPGYGFNYQSPRLDPEQPGPWNNPTGGYQFGGIVNTPKPIMNEYAPTRPEVITRQGQERRGMGEINLHNHIYIDSDEMKEWIYQTIKSGSKDGNLQIHPTAVKEF